MLTLRVKVYEDVVSVPSVPPAPSAVVPAAIVTTTVAP